MEICQAITPRHVDLARTLFKEYEVWLGIDLSFEGFAAELAGLPGLYAPPRGRLLLALEGGQPFACSALPAVVAELSRMVVVGSAAASTTGATALSGLKLRAEVLTLILAGLGGVTWLALRNSPAAAPGKQARPEAAQALTTPIYPWARAPAL